MHWVLHGFASLRGAVSRLRTVLKSRVTENLAKVFVDLTSLKSAHWLLGKKYVILVNDDFARYSWAYFLERKSDGADASGKFLADVYADGVPSKT